MDLYRTTSYLLSEFLTRKYSTSFSLSTQLFSADRRKHIYAIYGMVRIADEIVDSYAGTNQRELLSELHADVLRAIDCGYSANPLVHAFGQTARQYGITDDIIAPFFASMAMDIDKTSYTADEYATYIHGSAEVVGLMCLRVFTEGDEAEYQCLVAPASSLGAAYQKVNFLRDIKADHELGRWYFPSGSFNTVDEAWKQDVIIDIEADISDARTGLASLPYDAERAVALSIEYYGGLLEAIKNTPAEKLKNTRIRVSDSKKLALLAKMHIKRRRKS